MRNQNNKLTSTQKNCPAFRKTGQCGKVIAIDLDDTLFYNTCFPEIGNPIEGIIQEMQELKNQGYYLIIHTARISSDYKEAWATQLRLVQSTLDINSIPYNEIWQGTGKPVTCHLIDDKSWKSLSRFISYMNRKEGKCPEFL